MPSILLRSLFCLALAIPLGGCDFGRSDLGEAPPGDELPDGDPPAPESVCTATIDGSEFAAVRPGASTNDIGTTFALSCRTAGGSPLLVFELRPDGFGANTLALGLTGNQAQYVLGSEATSTSELGGEEAGEFVFTTFTRDRAEGTFRFVVPGFFEGEPDIHVAAGHFSVPVRLETGDG